MIHLPGVTHHQKIHLLPVKIGLKVGHQFMGWHGFHGRCNHLPRIGDCYSGPPVSIIDGYYPSQNLNFACKVRKKTARLPGWFSEWYAGYLLHLWCEIQAGHANIAIIAPLGIGLCSFE